jgi:hypothetical protein
MAVQEHNESSGEVPQRLQGGSARERWLSIREHRRFGIAAPDDSMTPEVTQGARLEFDTLMTPRDGDYVLIVDIAGRAFVREYRGTKSGAFQARPTNHLYRKSTFEAKRDGLVVLGVLTAVCRRMSRSLQ